MREPKTGPWRLMLYRLGAPPGILPAPGGGATSQLSGRSAAGQVPPLDINYARPAQHPRRLMPWALLKEAKRVYVFFIVSTCQLPSPPGLFQRVAPHDRHQSAPLPESATYKTLMGRQLHQRLVHLEERPHPPMVPWAARARTQ